MMGTAVFKKIGECVPVEQLLATGKENRTNINFATFGVGEYKRGQLVKLAKGVVTAYNPEAEFSAGDRFAIVKEDLAVKEGTQKATVYVTGSFYRDTLEGIAEKTISLADELEMNAEGIFLTAHL